MNLQDIHNDLIVNNAKTDVTHYSVEQLKTIFTQASIDVPNSQSGAITLTYSGGLNNTDAWKAAEYLGKNSNGQIRTVGQTEASILLGTREFEKALEKATLGDSDKAVRHNNQRALRRMHGIPMTGCLLVIAPYHFC